MWDVTLLPATKIIPKHSGLGSCNFSGFLGRARHQKWHSNITTMWHTQEASLEWADDSSVIRRYPSKIRTCPAMNLQNWPCLRPRAGLHHQMLRLPRKLTFQHRPILRLRSNITKYCTCQEQSLYDLWHKVWSAVAGEWAIRAWSEHIRAWNRKTKPVLAFPTWRRSLCGNAQRFAL